MKYILYLLLLVSVSSKAAVITTGVDFVNGSFPVVHYYSTKTTEPSGDLMAMKMYYFGVGVRRLPESGITVANLLGGNNYIALFPGDTWVQASQKFIDKYGTSGSMQGAFMLNPDYKYESCTMAISCYECGTLQYVIYPGSCTAIKPVPNTCSFDSSVLIDHGPLAVSEVNGNIARATATVRCTTTSKVVFRVTNFDGRIALGNNIYSDLYINGVKGVSDINYTVNSGGSTVNIESRLLSLNPLPGIFSGSTVIIADIL